MFKSFFSVTQSRISKLMSSTQTVFKVSAFYEDVGYPKSHHTFY